MTTYTFRLTLTKKYLFGLITRTKHLDFSKAFDSLAEARQEMNDLALQSGIDPSQLEYVGRAS